MDTFDAIHQRRSVKAFDPTHHFTAAEETKLLEAAIQSPTSFNMQNWRNAAPEIQKLVTGWMRPFYEGKEQLQRDEAMRSVGIVGQTIMLAAKAMGYDSCPMIGFDQAKVAEIINLPSDHAIGFMIAVGKAVKPAMPKGGQLALSEVAVQNRFA
jgi:nitroreductase